MATIRQIRWVKMAGVEKVTVLDALGLDEEHTAVYRWILQQTSVSAPSRTTCAVPGATEANAAYSPRVVRSTVTTCPPRAMVSQQSRLRK